MRVIPSAGGALEPAPTELLARARTLSARYSLRELTLLRFPELEPREGARVWLGLESLQVTGSFKVRGALLALEDERARDPDARVITASAGNHGAGVAWASRALGVRATVYVPEHAPESKKARIAAHAELVVAGDGYDACEAIAKEAARSSGAPFLSPYDDARVACGNGASLAFEIARAMTPSLALVPFGGGGLASGLAWGFEGRVPLWGVQSEASAAMALSLERGRAVTTMPAVETLAEALEGGISARAFGRARGAIAGMAVVSEAAIARAMAKLHELGFVVEGGGACALAAVSEGFELPDGDTLVLVTGRNVR